jgi:ribonuclease BN (tRNA processing enzyme)
MKVTILGSGTCVPSLQRSSCSALIETGNAKILVDVGAGTIRRLLEAGVMISQITHILISHLHLDHIGELASFLFSSKFPNPRKERLTIVAARGFADFFEGLTAVFGSWIELGNKVLQIIELPATGPGNYDFDDFVVQTLPMSHTAQSIGFRVTSQECHSVVYSGDTDYCDNLIDLAKGVDLLICECAHPDHLKVKGHLCPSLAGEIAHRAEVKQLVLTHFYPDCESSDIQNECRTTFQGSLILAKDLMTIPLPFEP